MAKSDSIKRLQSLQKIESGQSYCITVKGPSQQCGVEIERFNNDCAAIVSWFRERGADCLVVVTDGT